MDFIVPRPIAFRLLSIATFLALAPLCASHADEDSDPLPTSADGSEWQRLGLMRVRDMTPFGLARMDFLPAHAVVASPDTFAIETNLSYQNTWARSDNVADFLKARGSRRQDLSPADIASIMALPGDAYLVDGEYGLLDLTLHYRFSRHVGVYATVPYFFFHAGLLDDPIEGFHGRFGFGNAGREFVPHNRWQTIAKLRGTTVVMNEPPPNDFGDPVLGFRYSLKAHPAKWNLVVETAIKVPLQDATTLVSTGRTDYGLQLSYQRFFFRNAFYVTASGVKYSSPNPGLSGDQWIPTVVVGWETRLRRNLDFVLQLYGSRSTVQNTNLSELSADKMQLTAGLQWLQRGNLVRFGLTENVRSFNNTPDVGLTLSVGRIFSFRRH